MKTRKYFPRTISEENKPLVYTVLSGHERGIQDSKVKHLMSVTPTSAKLTLSCYKEEQTAM